MSAFRPTIRVSYGWMVLLPAPPSLEEREGVYERPLRKPALADTPRSNPYSARQSPDLPPVFSTRRTASMTMPFSAAFSMS